MRDSQQLTEMILGLFICYAMYTLEILSDVSRIGTMTVEDAIEPVMSKEMKDTNAVRVERRSKVSYYIKDSNPVLIHYT